MLDEERLLPIYAQRLSDAEWRALRAAAVSLGKEYRIKPVRAVQGSPGYILSIGAMPDFVCEGVAFVPNAQSVGLANAMHVVLEHVSDKRVIDVAGQLSKMIGGEVKELEPESVQTVAFV